MTKLRFTGMATLFIAMLLAFTLSASAGESYAYAGDHGFGTSFYLIGGNTPFMCMPYPRSRVLSGVQEVHFGGSLQRVWPTQDAMSPGAGVTISTIMPHKIGPTWLPLAAGLYRI